MEKDPVAFKNLNKEQLAAGKAQWEKVWPPEVVESAAAALIAEVEAGNIE